MQFPRHFPHISRVIRCVELVRVFAVMLSLLRSVAGARLLVPLTGGARIALRLLRLVPIRLRVAFKDVHCDKASQQIDLRAISSKDTCLGGLLTVILSIQFCGTITRLSWLLTRRTVESGRSFSIYMDANCRYKTDSASALVCCEVLIVRGRCNGTCDKH